MVLLTIRNMYIPITWGNSTCKLCTGKFRGGRHNCDHYHALWYFDTSVTYPQWFRKVKFVVKLLRFVKQQCLWNIAIKMTDGCYNSWANLGCSDCSPLGEKILWNRSITVKMLAQYQPQIRRTKMISILCSENQKIFLTPWAAMC